MRNFKFKKLDMLLLPLCFLVFSTQAFAIPSVPIEGNPIGGSFDPGVVDQTNLIQLKEYERKTRENMEEHERGREVIEMDKKMREQVDQLPNKEVSFKLNSIKFTGNTCFTEEQLMDLICERIGNEVTINDLITMANMVTEYYQQNGYISTIAYLPPQKVQDGNVEIVVMEGKYGKVEIEGNKWARDKFVRATYLKDKNIETEKVLNVRDIQETLREMNASGYMKGQVSMVDNEESAQYTDLTLQMKDRFPIDFDFRFDNQGRDAIGLNRAVFFAGMYNLTGWGDKLLSTTALARRSVSQGVFYSVPIGRHETKLNLGYSYSGLTMGEQWKDYDIKGHSHNFFAGLSRRLVKTENYKLYGDISLDIRNTKTTLGEQKFLLNEYKTRALRVNFTNIKDDFYGKWFGNIGASVGLPIMDASDEFDGYHERWLPTNKYVKVNANLARLQILPMRSMAIIQAGGQWASHGLYPSEKMQFGGISSVRGYEEGFLLSDYGVTASLEFRSHIPFLNRILPEKLQFIDDSIQWAAFYDAGWFGNVGTDTYGPSYVMSVGGGLIVRLTRYLSGNVYIGIPLGNKPEGASNCRVHFTITSNIL
ncbi:TPA: ShlB/FhaC/HecB family hemolysin secretion/activation protein [Candidatus Galligastranaerophilus intestinavium]|uniref:ShlB/FhaC/HecB family hemolysin secretion/activation protein n=1 Tax=Candidatus Galligastranaerophilus intestinavium TaxID=2840836 RepID=A0A9D1FIG6_9BACT|nr:ShlB/FhaC/HecB family hemolysin secretion/activation protein [Candidatus Galligastranaerophilus intestinavium]